MPDKRKVLFLCTGNSCRSQMAESLLRHIAGDRFEACSAGSQPAGFIHELATEAMARMNVPISAQRSKSWNEFADIPVDVVITVCDNAAKEICPNWSGSPLTAHWSLPDPSFHPGTAEERTEFALRIANRLRTKIEGLAELDWTLAPEELTERLAFLGEI